MYIKRNEQLRFNGLGKRLIYWRNELISMEATYQLKYSEKFKKADFTWCENSFNNRPYGFEVENGRRIQN